MRWFILYTVLVFKMVESNVNFCHNGYHTLIDNETSISNTRTHYHCPAGLLFKEPLTIHAIHSDSNRFCFKSDVCSENTWKCGTKSQLANVQLLTNFHQEPYQELRKTDENYNTPHCFPSSLKSNNLNMASKENNHLRKKRQTISLDDEKNNNITNEIIRKELMAQTKRMFYYLAGINPENVYSNLRSVKLLKRSAEILIGSCDPAFLKSQFIDVAIFAFKFLLKEQGTEKIQDIDVDSYELLSEALHFCTTGPSYTVTLNGTRCPMDVSVDTITRNLYGRNQSREYRSSPETFMWGKYDVVIDVAWHIVDFVHGLCFTTFKENINLHHLYQTAMEELFRNTIQIRWSRHSVLTREIQYDNIMLAPVNGTMQVLDACVVGSYIGSPFIHRLGRPIEDENLSRKRRDLNTETRTDDLMDIAYCLKTEKEQHHRIKEIRKRQCE